jgi:pSer/pThr/pTyr-binding forkhead associated (FHA) protein
MTPATPSISVTVHPKGAPPVERELLGTEISLGRARTCDLWVDDRYVSSQHAKLVWDGRQYLFADSGSSNGSWINGVKVIEVPLKPGDVISLGETRVAVDSVQTRAIPADSSAPSEILAPAPDRPAGTLPPRPGSQSRFLFEGLLREMHGDLKALREQYDYLIDRLGRMTDEDEHRLLERTGRKAQGARVA